MRNIGKKDVGKDETRGRWGGARLRVASSFQSSLHRHGVAGDAALWVVLNENYWTLFVACSREPLPLTRRDLLVLRP